MTKEQVSALNGYTSQYGVNYQRVNEYLNGTRTNDEEAKKAAEAITEALDHEVGVPLLAYRGEQDLSHISDNPKVKTMLNKVARGDFSSAEKLKEDLEGREVTSPVVTSTSLYSSLEGFDKLPVQIIYKVPETAKAVDITNLSAYGGGRSSAAAIFGGAMSYETELAFKPGMSYKIERVDFSLTQNGKKAGRAGVHNRIRKSVIVADALFLHFSRPAEQNTAFPMIRSNTYPRLDWLPSGIGALAGGDMKVNVLGTEYTVTTKKYDEDEAFERLKIVGYCDGLTKQIVLCDMNTCKGWEHEPPETIEASRKETLRHEIVHAFFNESGLASSSSEVEGPWAKNEEMVDWIAIQGPKIYSAWKEAGALCRNTPPNLHKGPGKGYRPVTNKQHQLAVQAAVRPKFRGRKVVKSRSVRTTQRRRSGSSSGSRMAISGS